MLPNLIQLIMYFLTLKSYSTIQIVSYPLFISDTLNNLLTGIYLTSYLQYLPVVTISPPLHS